MKRGSRDSTLHYRQLCPIGVRILITVNGRRVLTYRYDAVCHSADFVTDNAFNAIYADDEYFTGRIENQGCCCNSYV